MGTTDQSKLMFSIGLSGDSLDSSSEDDVIPMQSRKKKRSFTRKNRNNSRLGSSSSSFLKSNYSYGLCTLFKFVFVVMIIISVIIGTVVMYSLSKRMDSLQLSISGVQSANKDLPDDLHSLHSKYKSLEQESTNLKINLNNVIMSTSNLTQQTAQLQQKLNQLDLPTDVEQLRKMIADMNNESKLWQKNLELRMNALESRLQLLEQNLSVISSNNNNNNNNQSAWNQKIEQMITVIDNQIEQMNETFANLTKPSSVATSESLDRKKLVLVGNQTESDNVNH
ncbi:hypothetical protein DERP_000977 [Dermatophagoides pteronyssinus]|uniref:Uncharacterized protein n=1 Tax=Dermatophagoides pteronyssinus TaxID=6956 RepID=A0ABQ8JDX1_DERPT|nr:hypothetical protein DERP_000977 [Dermatophagoides pteronyssinus]